MKFSNIKYGVLRGALLLVACFVVVFSTAQTSKYDDIIDSLKTVIPLQEDTAKLVSIEQLDIYLTSSAPGEMMAYLEEGLELATELDHWYYQSRFLELLGTAHYYLAEYDKARELWERSVERCLQFPEDEYYEEARIRLVHSTALLNIGIIFRMRGDYTQALSYYRQSLDIRKTTGYKQGIAACYNNIARVYADNKNDDRALEYYLKALDILKDDPNDLYQASLLNNIGLIYRRKKELEKAESYFNQSLEKYKALDEPKRVSQSYVNLGLLHKDWDDCDHALDFFSLALIINKEISDRLGMAWCYQYIGECYAHMRQNAEALDYYHRALSILEELKVAQNQLACYEGLAEIYARIGQFEEAYHYKVKFSALSDSIYSDRLSGELAEQEAKYESAEKEKQLALKDLELEKKNSEIEKSRIRQWALVIGFLLVVAIAIIFIQRFRIEARFHKKLESQNEELRRTYENLKATVISKEEKEVMIKEIHHRVKNNLQIISSLVNLQANAVTDKNVQKMFREVQNRIISMSLLHEQLYKAPDLSDVNVEEYLKVLLDSLLKIYADEDKSISVKLDIEVESFGVDTLIPIGLLVNEVITNSLKYAFKDYSEGEITMEMKRIAPDQDKHLLIIADNGIGLDKEKLDNFEDSLGMELIQTFVSQLDGTVELDLAKGTKYIIEFYPLRRKAKLALEKPDVPAA